MLVSTTRGLDDYSARLAAADRCFHAEAEGAP